MADELIPDPFQTTLAAAIGGASVGASTTITLVDTSWITGDLSFATGVSEFFAYIGNPRLPASMEVVKVTQTSPSIIVTRGADGRTPVSHDTSHQFGPALRGSAIQDLIDQSISATTEGHVIHEGGLGALTQRSKLTFVGELVSATDNASDDSTDVEVFPPSLPVLSGIEQSPRAFKLPVRVATTGAGTLASDFENGDTVDGVVLATGNRILVKNQASGGENGIYSVAASGAPTRATDANAAAEFPRGSHVYVEEGTTNGGTTWVHTTTAAITLGTTALTFAQVGGSGGSGALVQADREVVGGGGAASVTLTIPGTGNALLIKGIARTDSGSTVALEVRFNGDTGTNYQAMYGGQVGNSASNDSAYLAGSSYIGGTAIDVAQVPGTAAPAGSFGSYRIEVDEYAATTAKKTVRAEAAMQLEADEDGLQTQHAVGWWNDTDAITSVTIFPSGGANFVQGTTFTAWVVT